MITSIICRLRHNLSLLKTEAQAFIYNYLVTSVEELIFTTSSVFMYCRIIYLDICYSYTFKNCLIPLDGLWERILFFVSLHFILFEDWSVMCVNNEWFCDGAICWTWFLEFMAPCHGPSSLYEIPLQSGKIFLLHDMTFTVFAIDICRVYKLIQFVTKCHAVPSVTPASHMNYYRHS